MKITNNDVTADATKRDPITTGEQISLAMRKRTELAALGKQWTEPPEGGLWRSSMRHVGLMQFIRSGTYYARAKVNGKSVRESLDTDVFTTAVLRLPDKLKALKTPKAEVGTFAMGRTRYESETRNGYTNRKNRLVKLAPLSVEYRNRCLELLRRSLVECLFHPSRQFRDLSPREREGALAKLDALKVDAITKDICEAWQTKFSAYSPTVFNNTLNTGRRVLELAGVGRDANHFYAVGRMDVMEKDLKLPTNEQFDRLLKVIETSGAAQAKDCADLVRFLSFTGCRAAEAKKAIWSDVDWSAGVLSIHSVKVRNSLGKDVMRELPINPALNQLLERLKREQNPQPTDRICILGECQKSLTRACLMVGCKRLVHHDLRHYFVSRCVQAKVDVLTLAKWIGHRDNGRLLLRVYAHLDVEHAKAEAAKVSFGAAPLPDNVLPLLSVAAS